MRNAPFAADPPERMQPATLTEHGRTLARAGRLDEALAAFLDAVGGDAGIVDAHLGIYEVAQILRKPELALAHQAAAIGISPVHSTFAGEREDYALLVLCAPGPYTANTPVDLIFDSRYVTLHRWYVDPSGGVPSLPPYDAVFVAIGESDAAAAQLRAAARFVTTRCSTNPAASNAWDGLRSRRRSPPLATAAP
jgi:hypothetical protein